MNRQINQAETPPSLTNPTLYTSAEPSYSTRDERPSSPPSEDDLLSSLSNAYENRRARQVFEWETIRRRAESNATARYFA
jgi:hypothetical protein